MVKQIAEQRAAINVEDEVENILIETSHTNKKQQSKKRKMGPSKSTLTFKRQKQQQHYLSKRLKILTPILYKVIPALIQKKKKTNNYEPQ